jgi:hypothetical protein
MKITISRWVGNEIVDESINMNDLVYVSFHHDIGGRVDVSSSYPEGYVRIRTSGSVGIEPISSNAILVYDHTAQESKRT